MMGCADTLLINGLLLIVPFIISLISTLVGIFLSRRLGSGHIMATGNDHMRDTGSDHMMDTESDHMMALASINDVYREYGKEEPAGVTIIKEEGLHFNKRGKLVDVNGDPFVFEIYQTREENQRRYETICMGIEWYVYDLLEELLLRVPVREDKKGTTIFVSEDFDKKKNLLILIHGSGAVRAGQWARRLIINNDLDSGTQLPYIRRALQLDWGVLVTNTNDNSDYKGCRSPPEHGAYVWKRFVKDSANKKIAIVAHSAGGHVCTTMLNENHRDFKNRVFAIAFTDSFGNPDHKNKEYFKKVTTNWVTSWHPLGTPIDERSLRHVSAGTTRHEETSHWAIEEVFQYIEDSFGSTVPGDAVQIAERRDAFKRNAERLQRDKETDVDTGKRIKRDNTGAATNLNAVHANIEKEGSLSIQQVRELRKAMENEKADKQTGKSQMELTEYPDRDPLANKAKQAERGRVAKDRVEKEVEKERLEKERMENKMEKKEGIKKERMEKERMEKERMEKERMEKERKVVMEKERMGKERKEGIEKERMEKERMEKERVEKERKAGMEKERMGKERKEGIEKERMEKERMEKERKAGMEKERMGKERKEGIEKERMEERVEKERMEKERKEGMEKERMEKEWKERMEKERTEKEWKERAEKERMEKERVEKEKEAKEKAIKKAEMDSDKMMQALDDKAQRMKAKPTKAKAGKPQQGKTSDEETGSKKEGKRADPNKAQRELYQGHSERKPKDNLGKHAQKTSEEAVTHRQYDSNDTAKVHGSDV
ncbi:apical junction molecule-like [Watersipora subatra]|uniref:apical junction molecule-like n=1 Tax=Watersipora subatra TaxID=2589382 RepID=UPI00355C3BF4